MNRTDITVTGPRQRGAILLLLLLLLIVAAGTVLVHRADRHRAPRAQVDRAVRLNQRAVRALLGQVVLTGCLPCPAPTPDRGLAPPQCSGQRSAGYLPWETLGIGAQDPWNNRLRYVVDPAFAGGCHIGRGSRGRLQLLGRDAGGRLRVLASGLPAVIVSHGPNGYGAAAATGRLRRAVPANHVDERTNRNSRQRFVQGPAHQEPAVAGGPFDDIVTPVPLDAVLGAAARHGGNGGEGGEAEGGTRPTRGGNAETEASHAPGG